MQLQVSLPTQYNNKNQDPVGALSSALSRLQANRPLRELREIAKVRADGWERWGVRTGAVLRWQCRLRCMAVGAPGCGKMERRAAASAVRCCQKAVQPTGGRGAAWRSEGSALQRSSFACSAQQEGALVCRSVGSLEQQNTSTDSLPVELSARRQCYGNSRVLQVGSNAHWSAVCRSNRFSGRQVVPHLTACGFALEWIWGVEEAQPVH